MNSDSYVTIVPIYKAHPSKADVFALLQLRALDIKNVILMCPEGLDLQVYFNLWPDLLVERFESKHFLSVQTYNNLMLDAAFYERFSPQYEWMLISQPDAFLFSNQISHFCSLGYDYYGAPWLKGFPKYRFLFNRWPIRINPGRFYVGNGGLSLRKLNSTIDLLHRRKNHMSKTFFMEDVFFGYWGSRDRHFHACPADIGAAFSCETFPEYWIKLTGKFPMGTHNFEREVKEWGAVFFRPTLQTHYANLLKSFLN